MNKNKKFTKYIFDSVYRVGLELIVNMTQKQANAHILKEYSNVDKIEISQNFNACLGKIQRKGACIGYFIWINHFDWTIESQGTVAHEIWHLVTWSLMERGIDLDHNSDEAFAYYYGYWFRSIWKELKVLYDN